MKNRLLLFLAFFLSLTAVTGCGVVEGIFKAGMIWGILLVCGVIFGIIYLISRGRRK